MMEIESRDKALAFQTRILAGVSRTFAITIPELPQELNTVVGNAYLLCRIADTIEDDEALTTEEKEYYHALFVKVVRGEASSEVFANELAPKLSDKTLDKERELISQTVLVILVTRNFSKKQQRILIRCVEIMCGGMPKFARQVSLKGLKDLSALNHYCYYVAGVVGEMLTELFCDYSSEVNSRHGKLSSLAISFGQGLQMTNILKDISEDKSRGVNWLPQNMSLDNLIGVAGAHLSNALKYAQTIPKKEVGIRRFCLRAIGMAALTLRKINANAHLAKHEQLKITRRSVKATLLITNLLATKDTLQSLLFNKLIAKLPQTNLLQQFQPKELSEFGNVDLKA